MGATILMDWELLSMFNTTDTPAGNVTTATVGQILQITGDAADNAIEVRQFSPSQYRIIGLYGTTVDGKPEVVAKSKKDLCIDLAAGRDEALLTGVSVARDTGLANSEEVSIVSSTVGKNLSLTIGDEVLIEGTGAYTTTYSAVAFNGFEPLRSYVI